jgi:hypothetical protein
MIVQCHRAKRNVVIFRSQPETYGMISSRPPQNRRIDVWWGGLQANGGLMLILAYLMRTGWAWRGAEIRLNLVVPNAAAQQAAKQNLAKIVQNLRIGATPRVILADNRPFEQILHTTSAKADLVFLGLATPSDNFTAYYRDLQQRTMGLPPTIFVLASEELEFAEVLQKE